MSPGYFVMPLQPRGSDPACILEQRLDRLGSLDALRFEEVWIGEHFTAAGRTSLSGPSSRRSARNALRSFPLPAGEHLEVTLGSLETILTLWPI